MENTDLKMSNTLSTDGLHKSAIIYRDDSARFIYVCYHCSRMFIEINETLKHIESHFQLANVVLDQFVEEESKEQIDCFAITSATDTVGIKMEIFDNNEADSAMSTRSEIRNKDGRVVDWFSYEAAGSMNLEQSDDVTNKNLKRTASSEETSTGKKIRKKSAIKPVCMRPYRCHKCSQNWKLKELRNHLKTHADDELLQIYKCKECDCYYKNAFALRMHVLGVHLLTKRFSCNACDAQFNFSQDIKFEKHLQLHNGTDQKLWTDIRDGINHRKGDYSKYEETNSFTEEQYRCGYCSQRFYIKCNFDVHMKSAHSGETGQRRLQCRQCDSNFTTRKYYFAHQLEHERVGSIITERDENVLLAKLEACIDERIIYEADKFSKQSYRCSVCLTTFDGLDGHSDIRPHIRERHVYKMLPSPMGLEEFICDMCGKRLKTRYSMLQHLQIHTKAKSHSCTFCGKMFRQSGDRTIHERQHTGEKPFQCHTCGKAFLSKGHLTAHAKSHDDTTYPCTICGKVFNLPHGYRNHIKTHRQDRPFKCTVCDKTFNTRIYLTRHMVIHSGKQYQCRFCECKFNTSDGRGQHYKHKHKYAMA